MWPIVAFLLQTSSEILWYETAYSDLTDDPDAYYTATESSYSTSSQPKARKKKKKKRRERREKLIEIEWTYVGNKNDDEAPNLVMGNPAIDLVCVSPGVYILRPANAAAPLPILNMPPPGQPEAQSVIQPIVQVTRRDRANGQAPNPVQAVAQPVVQIVRRNRADGEVPIDRPNLTQHAAPVVKENKTNGQVSSKRDSEKNQNGEKAKKAIEKAKTNIAKSFSVPTEPFREPNGNNALLVERNSPLYSEVTGGVVQTSNPVDSHDVANKLEMGIQNLEEKIKNEFEAKYLQNDTVEPIAFDFRESFNDMWFGLDDGKPGSPQPGADNLWFQRRFSLADSDIKSLFPLLNKKN